MIENGHLLDVAADGLILVLLLNKTALLVSQDCFTSSLNLTTGLDLQIYASTSHTTVCTDSEYRFHATPEFIRLFFPTLFAIQARTSNSTALQIWTKFAGPFGLTEQSVLEEWKRDMQCCNPSCPKRGESGGISAQRCSRCKNINYCGLNCQRRL